MFNKDISLSADQLVNLVKWEPIQNTFRYRTSPRTSFVSSNGESPVLGLGNIALDALLAIAFVGINIVLGGVSGAVSQYLLKHA